MVLTVQGGLDKEEMVKREENKEEGDENENDLERSSNDDKNDPFPHM